jgi:hypothetical protein
MIQMRELPAPGRAPSREHHVQTERSSGYGEEVLHPDLARPGVRETGALQRRRIKPARDPVRGEQSRPRRQTRARTVLRQCDEHRTIAHRTRAAIAELAIFEGEREVSGVQRRDAMAAAEQPTAPSLRQLDLNSVGVQSQARLPIPATASAQASRAGETHVAEARRRSSRASIAIN